jgi:hypothetical protein
MRVLRLNSASTAHWYSIKLGAITGHAAVATSIVCENFDILRTSSYLVNVC